MTFEDRFSLISQLRERINTAGTTNENFPFIFRVEIQQNRTGHKSRFKGKCTGQPGFFVHSYQAFERSVLNFIGSQHSQLCGNADSAVGAQCCSVGFHPAVNNHRFNGIVVKIKNFIAVFFTNHIHVGLQNNHRQVFLAGICRFGYQNIAGLVGFGCQMVFLCKIK